MIETDTQTDCQVLQIVFNIDFTDFPKSNLIVMRIYFFLLVSLWGLDHKLILARIMGCLHVCNRWGLSQQQIKSWPKKQAKYTQHSVFIQPLYISRVDVKVASVYIQSANHIQPNTRLWITHRNVLYHFSQHLNNILIAIINIFNLRQIIFYKN